MHNKKIKFMWFNLILNICFVIFIQLLVSSCNFQSFKSTPSLSLYHTCSFVCYDNQVNATLKFRIIQVNGTVDAAICIDIKYCSVRCVIFTMSRSILVSHSHYSRLQHSLAMLICILDIMLGEWWNISCLLSLSS